MLMKNNPLYQATFPLSSYSSKKFLHGGIMRYLWRPRLWFQHEGTGPDRMLLTFFIAFGYLCCSSFACIVTIHAIPPGFCRMQELNLQIGQYVGVHIRRGDKGIWWAMLARDMCRVTFFQCLEIQRKLKPLQLIDMLIKRCSFWQEAGRSLQFM
jgi:hypothetical protein